MMELLVVIGLLLIFGIATLIVNSNEAAKRKDEARRAEIEEARGLILNSGNQRLIDFLRLMDETRSIQEEKRKGKRRHTDPSGMEIVGGIVGVSVLASLTENATEASRIGEAFAVIHDDTYEQLATIGSDSVSNGSFHEHTWHDDDHDY